MKRFLRILSIALLAALLSVSALAEGSFIHAMEWKVLEDGSLRIPFYCSMSDIRQDRVKLMLDDVELPIEALKKEDSARDGSSWVFLVDTASVGTGGKDGSEPISLLMPELIKLVGSGDNGAVITNGSSYTESLNALELSSTQNMLELQIKGDMLHKDRAKTGMYQTIAAVASFLGNSEAAKPQRNLVLISQGTTTDPSDPDIGNIRQTIQNAGITVYCIVFPPKDGSVTAVQNFISLAEDSRSGMVFSFDPEDYKGNDKKQSLVSGVVNAIMGNDIIHYVISANPAASGVSGTELTLEVEGGNGMVMRERYSLNEEEQQRILGNIPEVSEPTPEPTLEPTPEPTPNPYPISFVPLTLQQLLIVGGCILLAITIVIIAVVLSHKKVDGDYGPSSPITGQPGGISAGGPPSMPGGAPDVPGGMQYEAGSAISPSYPPDRDWMPPPSPELRRTPPALSITLTQIDGMRNVYRAQINDNLLIGRNPESAGLVLPDDDLKISGKHLILHHQNGRLFAEDISRNGTLLNGERIYQPTALHQQDVLTLGKTRLRIEWSIR